MGRFDLQGKRVLVTGASSGIGEAVVRRLARMEAHPILVARRAEELDRVATDIRHDTGREVAVVAADITRQEDRRRMVHAVEGLGPLHVLINNAGITAHGRFDETAPAVMRRAMELNFFSMAELTQELLPIMRQAPGEKMILLVSTPSGLYGIPGRFAYSASKSAGHALMEALRMELHADRFHTCVFCPGYTRTNLRTSGLAGDGSTLQDEQARGARSPDEVAERLLLALARRKRFATVGINGHAIYWLRTLAPGLLERISMKKLKDDMVAHEERQLP